MGVIFHLSRRLQFEFCRDDDLASAYHNMALFTPMSADIWGENHADSRLFMMHEMRLEQHLRNRKWLRSALVTGTTLLRHVHHFAQLEMSTVDSIHMGLAAQVFDVKRGELDRWFALPTFDGWYAQVGTRLSTLQKSDRRPESVALRPERVKWLAELEMVIPMVVVPAS